MVSFFSAALSLARSALVVLRTSSNAYSLFWWYAFFSWSSSIIISKFCCCTTTLDNAASDYLTASCKVLFWAAHLAPLLQISSVYIYYLYISTFIRSMSFCIFFSKNVSFDLL
jgi:hypothetical protein